MSTYEISKSSLLSLKAEILRKQQELAKTKVENEVKKKALKKNPLEIKNKGIEAREQKDNTDINEDLLKKSRSVLEHKTRLYDQLSKEKHFDKDQKGNKYLVRFDKKRSIEDLPPDDSEPDKEDSESEGSFYKSDEENDRDPGEKWVDYVDCFGRTRRCMQKDLEYLKSNDKELIQIVEEKKKNQDKETATEETYSNKGENVSNEEILSDNSSATELLSIDMRREFMRQKWEKEEEELRNKSNIHYQDLLFGEARSHGVGYYGFSKDEEERAKQQESLRKLREDTESKQKKAQEMKNSREKILAARLKAARNRKRARMGLPPEEDVPETDSVLEETEEPKEKEQTESDEKEHLLAEARKNHIRPWDIGKEGMKERQIMTQKEWVEQKREERPKEFAPPTNFIRDFRANAEQNEKHSEDEKILKFTTKRSSKNKKPLKSKNNNKLSDFEDIQQGPIIHPSTIEDLSTDHNFEDFLLKDYERVKNSSGNKKNEMKGTEIPPPPTYDYYGPSQSKIRKNKEGTNIHESIEAGLKFLRKQVEEKEKSTKHPDDMFLF